MTLEGETATSEQDMSNGLLNRDSEKSSEGSECLPDLQGH